MPKPNATTSSRLRLPASALAGVVALAFGSVASADPVWDKIGEIIGKTGTEMPGAVYRIALPRTDIKATLDEQPRLFFVHFWANDDARKLAQGLKSALDHINVAKS